MRISSSEVLVMTDADRERELHDRYLDALSEYAEALAKLRGCDTQTSEELQGR